MFYMFLAFPLTFSLLIPLPVHLIVLSFSNLSIVSSMTFVLVRGLVWGVRMVVRSMSLCGVEYFRNDNINKDEDVMMEM